MTEINMTIDLNNFARLPPSSRISLLEAAMMFGVLPEANIPSAKAYIAQLTATIVDPVQNKTLVLEGGVHKLANVIRETFPHVIELRNEISSEKLEDFANTHQISHNDFVGCGGTDSEWSTCALICFKNVSDAILAKLYFRDSILYGANEGPEQIEVEIAKKSNGYAMKAMNSGGDCSDPDDECSYKASTTVVSTKRSESA